MIGTLRRELPDRLLTVSEHHLRHVLTEYLWHCKHRPAAVPPARSPRRKLKPARPNWSTSPTTGPAGSKSLGELTHEYYIAA